jgi:hypothetical protein
VDDDGWGGAMIGIIIAVIIGILLIGVVLKILKIAIILALVVGAVMLAQNKFGQNRDSGRIK